MKKALLMTVFAVCLFSGSLSAGAAEKFYCKYCGEQFHSADSARFGSCLYSANRRHVLSTCTSASNLFCRFCGERFSNPSSVRLGTCLYSADKKHQLP